MPRRQLLELEDIQPMLAVASKALPRTGTWQYSP